LPSEKKTKKREAPRPERGGGKRGPLVQQKKKTVVDPLEKEREVPKACKKKKRGVAFLCAQEKKGGIFF